MNQHITGVILAGGAGARFGGADKGLLACAGQPFIEWVLARVRPQVGPLLISANRHSGHYARYGFPIIADEPQGHAGPLAGIQAALAQVQTAFALIVPVDALRLPDDLAQRLYTALGDGDAAVVHDGRAQIPVCCLLRTRCRVRFAGESARSVKEVLLELGARDVNFDAHPREFWSCNTPAELSALEKALIWN